jgi:F-type H+-transporting ATPase subunit epsilon
MPKPAFAISIVTPERTAFEGSVTSLVFPGLDGAIGVWAHHAPMVAAMRAGVVFVEAPDAGGGKEVHYAVGPGFAEVRDNRAMLLVDCAELESSIDVDRARAAMQRAKERIAAAAHDRSIDLERAQAARDRAEARLKAAYLKGA